MKIFKLALAAKAYLLPSVLRKLDFKVSPAVMEEDREEGSWGESELVAMSKGWKFDVRKFLGKELAEAIPFTGHPAITYSRRLGGAIQSRETRHKELEKKITDILLGHGIPFKGRGVFQIDPMTFGPVNIDEENWSRVEIRGAAVTQLDHNRLEPARAGAATVIVRVRTDGERFGGASTVTAVNSVQVLPISLKIEPTEATLQPEELKDFVLTVENSAFPHMVEVEALTGEAFVEPVEGASSHLVTYSAPAQAGFTDRLLARHTATTGACQTEPGCGRSVFARINGVGTVTVDPEKLCVDPEEVINIRHEVVGIEDQRVVWEPADIASASGRFTAPDSPGIVVVTATSVADSRIKGQASIKVGGCSCWWSVLVEGRRTFSQPMSGDFASFVVGEESLSLVELSSRTESQGLLMSPLPPGSVPVVPGTYFFGGFGQLGLSPSDFLYTVSPDEPLTASLTDFTDSRMQARIAGSVGITSFESGDRKADIVVNFRVTADPEFSGVGQGCFTK